MITAESRTLPGDAQPGGWSRAFVPSRAVGRSSVRAGLLAVAPLLPAPAAVVPHSLAPDAYNEPPIVKVTTGWTEVEPGGRVSLTATAEDLDGAVNGIEWTATAGRLVVANDWSSYPVESGATWTAPNEPGDVDITVTAVDNDGLEGSASVTVTVTANPAPWVTVTAEPGHVVPGGVVRLTATAGDPDGGPVTYAWSAPSGTFDATDAATATWTAPSEPGVFEIRVEVTDDEGQRASAAERVIVSFQERLTLTPGDVVALRLTDMRVTVTGAMPLSANYQVHASGCGHWSSGSEDLPIATDGRGHAVVDAGFHAYQPDEDGEYCTVQLEFHDDISGWTAQANTNLFIRRNTSPPPTPTPMVSLSASPNPVEEGESVTVTAGLSEALASSVTIPLTLAAGTAESDDYGSLASITVNAGVLTGTGTVTTAEDADQDDETFTVALGTLPARMTAGNPSSVEVRIRDDDGDSRGGDQRGGDEGGGDESGGEPAKRAPEAAWYLPPASDPARQGFVRVVNHSGVPGDVSVTATDDAGHRYEPLTLALGPRAAAHFNTADLESGNATKGLTGATGPGEGGWRLEFESETLDVEALAYVRTADGFLAGMNATAPRGADGALHVPTFNPASNVDQVSLLRLVNPSAEEAAATVTGVDDAGASPGSPVTLALPAGSACTVDAAQLESGMGLACGAPQAGFGDGSGKWRLTVGPDAPLVAMSLLSGASGHLTNLSGKGEADFEGTWHVDLFPTASDALGRQGFVRVANRSAVRGTVTIVADDDSDTRYETLRLSLGAGETAHFNSGDLELGNRVKGLTGGTGSGTGTWRLRLYSSLDIEVNAYVRTDDGFLTAMHDAAPRRGGVRRLAFFNPGSNERTSVLRLVNRSRDEAEASVDGTDDLGLRPGTTVRVSVPATDAVELTAVELESGEHEAIVSGALGDGAGKWRLRVESSRVGAALSLLSSPAGHLTNLSRADASRGLGPLPAALLPAPATVTLESPGARQLRGRWSAVAGARYDVDLLRDGVADEDRSLTRTRNTTTSFRWMHLLPGAYAIRVRSVNEDRLGGPWRESGEVVID